MCEYTVKLPSNGDLPVYENQQTNTGTKPSSETVSIGHTRSTPNICFRIQTHNSGNIELSWELPNVFFFFKRKNVSFAASLRSICYIWQCLLCARFRQSVRLSLILVFFTSTSLIRKGRQALTKRANILIDKVNLLMRLSDGNFDYTSRHYVSNCCLRYSISSWRQ